jgi:hypothetical protein
MRKSVPLISLFTLTAMLFIPSCSKKNEENLTEPASTTTPNINNTLGFSVLNKLKGIWNGPVTSTTAVGSYPEWIVDFRPISENQISAKNELDTLNDIHMSFFIALHNNEYKVCFRNGGSFGGMKRVSYFLADSVSEGTTKSFYRFTEIIQGKTRAYTEVIFSNDSLYLKSYTNVYNTLPAATPHMSWTAKLQDTTSYAPSVSTFDFPKKSMTKDFTTTFNGMPESIFYGVASDPYPETAQPYLGKTTVNYSYAGGYTPVATNKVFILITTQPLISGFTINMASMATRSRYVILSADDLSFDFNYMHPGNYYVYALYDADGNNTFSSGDWVSAANTTFTLSNLGTASASTVINFTIP